MGKKHRHNKRPRGKRGQGKKAMGLLDLITRKGKNIMNNHPATSANGTPSIPDPTVMGPPARAATVSGGANLPANIGPRGQQPTTPAASANTQRHTNGGYAHNYGANYGNYGGGRPATPYVYTPAKTARERTYDEHAAVRAKTGRTVTMHEPGMQTLLNMLTFCRPHESATEKEFISRWIAPLPGAQVDEYGNHWVEIGKNPNIMWSSHTDTVHRKAGRQKIIVGDGIVTAKDSNCLGADCTAGVWLMTEMIHAKVEGLYIFHRCEERGGLGSSYIARTHAADLAGIDAAIAFDRRGLSDIITYQGDMCASDAFANSLAAILNGPNLALSACPNGVFTDTANYTEIIPECTNLSVGYFSEHNSTEYLSLRHLFALRDAIQKADFSKLVIQRKPGQGSLASNWKRGRTGTVTNTTAYGGTTTRESGNDSEALLMTDTIRANPYAIACIFENMGWALDDLMVMMDIMDGKDAASGRRHWKGV